MECSKSIVVRRTHKLGDILCALPVIKGLENSGYKVYFDTNEVITSLLHIKSFSPSVTYDNYVDLHYYESGKIVRSNFGNIHLLNNLWYGSITENFLLLVEEEIRTPLPIPEDISSSFKFDKPEIYNNLSKYVIIHRLSNDPSKNKMLEFWDEIISFLLVQGLNVIEIGGKDVEKLKPSKFKSHSSYLDFRGKLTLPQLAFLIKKAKLFVGLMSGPSHIANFLKTPGVIVSRQYGPFDFHNPYFGFYKSQKKVAIFYFKNSPYELDIEAVKQDIAQLLSGKELKPKFPNKFPEGIRKVNLFLLSNDKYIIWGAGSFGQAVFRILKNLGKQVSFFVDSDSKKWGKTINGLRIMPPSILGKSKKKDEKIIIASLWWPEISHYLELKLGFRRWIDYL